MERQTVIIDTNTVIPSNRLIHQGQQFFYTMNDL